MFDWLKLALVFAQIADAIINGIRARRELAAGEDKAVAAAGLAILKRSQAGKEIMEKIDAMGDDQLGDLIDALGRDGDAGKG